MAGKSTVLSDDEDEMEVYDNEEEADVDDDDEDEAGHDEYENDGFIVDDEEEPEDGGDSDEEKEKKKKRKKKDSQKNFVLDEDDYELLEDNNITGFRRPEESKKFKRLKKAQRGHHSGLSDGDEFDRSGRGVRMTEEMLNHSLFGDDIAEEEQLEEDDEIGDDDDMSGFIVEEDLDEHGSPMRRKVTKKQPRPGISSSALQEAHDIFGNVDDLLKHRKQGLAEMSEYYDASGRRKQRRTVDDVEPIILSEKYMTEKDDLIRKTDFPERLQVFEHSTGPPPTTESSIDEESIWICNQLRNMIHLYGRIVETSELSIVKEDVMRFLDFIHVQKLDVPFIAMYRKDECPSLFRDPEQLEADAFQNSSDIKPALMWHKVLWTILDLDKKWLLLQKRKSALHSYYKKRYAEESRVIDDETRLFLNRQLFDSITKSLREAQSEREVDDVDLKFNLHFPPGEVGDIDGQYKRPKRKSQYSCFRKAGLWGLASKFGYSSEQFGLQLSLEKMRMEELLDSKETPEEAASNFICAMFGTSQNVLRGARHMAAIEICCEPYVRKHVRSIYMDNAVVSTSPTADGNAAIDTSHQYATIKWLREKPLAKFVDAQWLLIHKAEEQKLIKVTIKLPEPVLTKLISDSNENYLSDGVSKSAQLWNEQRKLILQDAIFDFLQPSMEKEARSLLASRAKSWLLLEYGKLLRDRVCVAPYRRKEHNPSADEETAPRVMACCWGPGKPATTFVMLDSSGEVLDILYAGSICNRGQSVNDQQRKKNDQQRVLKFMTEHQPHVVVLGAANLSCTRLKEDIYEIVFKMVEETPREVGQEMDSLDILYGDEALPHHYENSGISSDQLPLQPGIVKRAVALGRYLQNPLAMAATLCGPGKEILSWKLSPLDDFLTSDEKFGMIEQIMVDVTNQVGLDINLALSHEWLFSTMQFISGLGPRKAASLTRSLVRSGAIFTRKDLLTEHGIGKKVFINSVGFLRVRRNGMAASSNQFIDLLDDTRIHPESYGLAQELAKDVYLEDVQDVTIDDDEVLQMAIEHVREKPHLLKSLEVHEYAKSKRSENKMQILNLIRLELIDGFQDWRKPYAAPSQDEEFCMISGETEDSLAEGRVVQATIRRVLPQKAICILDSGLVGILAKEDVADDWKELPDLSEKLKEGDIVNCKIKSILKNRYQLFLSCKESEMRNDQYENHQNLDPYYHEDHISLPEKVRKQKELGRKHFKPRMIVHPRFQNITADEAVEFLAEKDIGESVVRPSSRGPSFLTLTLKVYDGIYAHKDILEGGKEHKDIASLLRIGKTLKIGDDTFEDLDEVIDRYVDPLVVQLKVMLNYRKFKKGTKAEVDELLRIEKAENPMRIVYCFGISHEHPGTCILTFIRSSNPHHEYVGVYPTGFKFRRKMFGEIDRLVAYFQRHIDDPQKSAPSIRSVAAMVPMGSPATGGQAGGWDGSSDSGNGWGGQSSDQDQTFTPGSRAGRGDFRNGGSQDGHPSGIPRPYGGRGRGRGRGRGSYNGSGRGDGRNSDKKDLDSGIQSDGGGTGGWGGNGGAGDGTAGSWGGSVGNTGGGSSGGWGGSGGDASGGGSGGDSAGGWGGSGGSGGGSGGAWGGNDGGSGGSAGGWGGRGGDTGGGTTGTGGWGGSGGDTGSGASGGWGGNGDGTGGGSGGTAGGWGTSGGNTGGTTGTGGWGKSGGDTGGTAGGWGGSGGDAGGGASGGWGGSGDGTGGGSGASGGDNGGYGGNGGGSFGGIDSGGGGRGRGRDSRGRGRGRDGRGRGRGADGESGGSSWGGRRGGGGNRGRGGGGRGWGARGGSDDVEGGGNGDSWGGSSGNGGWGGGSSNSWGGAGNGSGGNEGGGGSGGWGVGKGNEGGGGGSSGGWGVGKGNEGGGRGSGWGSGSNSSWGATGNGSGDDKGSGGSGGWGADKSKGGGSGGWGADKGKGGGGDDGGGSGTGGWGSGSGKGKEGGGGGGSGWGSGGGDDKGGGGSGGWGADKSKGGGSGGWGGSDDGGGSGNGGWGGGNAGSGASKDVPKSGGSGWG